MSVAPSVRVIGIGNDLRGDDAAGLEVARRLRAGDLPPGVEVSEGGGEALDLLELWSGAETVILIDAVRSGAPAGTLHRLDASRAPLPTGLERTSSHTVSIAEAVELARELGRLPPEVIVFGIEGARAQAGAPLSDGVQQGVERAVRAVREEIRRRATRTEGPPAR